jgi:S-adenosylmethionine decarboxylase proenzyme
MSTIVYQGTKQVGKHLIINLYNVHYSILSHLWTGRLILDNIIEQLNLHVVNEAGHQFDPYGYTIAYVLSESHLTIHTYPEYNSAYIDIFCCNPDFNPIRAIGELKDAFQTDTVTYHIVNR